MRTKLESGARLGDSSHPAMWGVNWAMLSTSVHCFSVVEFGASFHGVGFPGWVLTHLTRLDLTSVFGLTYLNHVCLLERFILF